MRVKVTTMFPYFPFIRQTPRCTGVWDDVQFIVDSDEVECDAWVIYGALNEPITAWCPQGNTILLDDEPADVRVYEKGYTAQFDSVIGCQQDGSHKNYVLRQQGHPWHVGINRVTDHAVLDFDALRHMPPPEKPRLLSVICSTKTHTPGHRLRLKFVDRLRDHFGDKIDVFGRGIRPVGDKWEAVAPYHYHIALENSCVPHYISEKLTDSFLGWAYPFYHGCPNVNTYFSSNALTAIDISKPEQAIEIIEHAIEDNLYAKRLDDLRNARNLAMDQYSFFANLAEYCKTLPLGPRLRRTIKPDWTFRRSPSLRKRLKWTTKSLINPWRLRNAA